MKRIEQFEFNRQYCKKLATCRGHINCYARAVLSAAVKVGNDKKGEAKR